MRPRRRTSRQTRTSSDEDIQSGLIVLDRHATDGAEVTHFRISGISAGTLTQADGTTVVNDGDYITVAQGQAGLRFTAPLHSYATESFNVQSSEDGSTVAAQSGVATSTISVTAVNDAAVNSVPGPQTTNEETLLTFSTANGNALSISDLDAFSNTLQVTLTASDGTLTLGSLNPIGSETVSNTTTADDQLNSVIAMAPDGTHVVVWQSTDQDDPDGLAGIYARIYNADGTPQTGEILINENTPGDQLKPSVGIDDSGNFVVAWEGTDANKDGVYARVFNAAGVAQTGEFLVNQTTADDQREASVAVDADGDFVVAWESKGQDDGDNKKGVYARLYNSAGVAQTNEFLVNQTTAQDQKSPSASMDDAGNFVVAWESKAQGRMTRRSRPSPWTPTATS